MAITSYQVSLNNAVWIDLNSRNTQVNLPDRLPDQLAIENSLYNLFNCQIGARGRIFEPTYGSAWLQFLQEPIDEVTAAAMRVAMIQAIQLWEPRIILDFSRTSITPDTSLPGYRVRIAGTEALSKSPIAIQFIELP